MFAAALLLGSSLADASPPRADLARGYRHLAAGHWRMAEDVFRAAVEADATDTRARGGLAMAYAGEGRCTEALSQLQQARPTGWRAELARTEGRCLSVLGDISGAAAAYEEALVLDPNDAESMIGLGRTLLVSGDVERASGLAGDLGQRTRPPLQPTRLSAWIAVETGVEVDRELDGLRARFPKPGRNLAIDLTLMDGTRWMDVGDPCRAARVLREGVVYALAHPETAAARAEALRRCGDAEGALVALDRPRIAAHEHVAVDLIRARIVLDLGELDTAERLLADLDPAWSEVAATWWLLARARRNATESTRWASRWDALNLNPERTLQQLVPVEYGP